MAKTMDDSLFEDKKYTEPQKMDDTLFEDVQVPQVSALEAAGRGAVQGLSLGFSEELGAGVMSAVDAARRALGIKTEEEKVNELLQAQGFKGDVGQTAEQKDVLSQYRQMRDTARQADKLAKEQQGGAYLAGELAGGIAPAIVSGGTSIAGQTGVKAAALAGAKAGAKYGAASGLGMGEADLTQGEIGQAAKETVLGAATGATLGGAIPVVGEGAKQVGKVLKNAADTVTEGFLDMTGELGNIIVKAGKMAKSGEEIVSKSALEKTTQDIANSAEKLATTVDKVTRTKAKNLISESLDSEQKINLTDTIDTNISKVDEALSELVPDSAEAKILGNIKAKFTKMKVDLLKEAGQDPTLPTKKEAYAKLLEKKQTLEAIQNVGAPQAQALDNLFNKAAKIKGDWKAGSIDAQRIQRDFQLPDEESAIEMVKDIAKLKLKKPTVDPVSGMVIDMPIELTQVIKKYQPEILEKEGRLMLQTAPGKISPSDVLKFRPDEITQPINLTPQQLLNLRDELRGQTFGQQGIVKKVGTDITEGLTQKLETGLEKISPENLSKFKEGMKTYSDIYGLEDLLGTQLKNTVDKQGALTSEGMNTVEKLTKYIEKEMTGLEPGQQQVVLKGIKDKIKGIPELGDKFLNAIENQSQLKTLQEKAYNIGNIKLFGPIEAMGVRVGAGAGRVIRLLEQSGEKLSGSSTIDKLSKASSDQIKKVSQFYRQKGSEKTANFLDELANVSSTQKKGALLFTASQNPNIKDELFGEEENP